MAEKFDIMQVVTDKIIEALESGTAPWTQPWVGGNGCIKHKSGMPYSLLNQIMLGKPGEYLSYKEAQAEGGRIKKGAKGKMVVFWKVFKNVATDKDGNAVVDVDGNPQFKTSFFLRYYTVFHIDDCEGIEKKWDKKFDTKTIDSAEKVLDDYAARAKVRIEKVNSDRAFYRPSEHMIQLPLIEQFKDQAEYYSTAFHEATHSTGHHTLLNRFPQDAIMAAFGSDSYSREELTAEIGACAIMSRLGIQTDNAFRNSAAYINGWLHALKNDKKLIISAAGKAEKAIKLIMNDKDDEQAADEVA